MSQNSAAKKLATAVLYSSWVALAVIVGSSLLALVYLVPLYTLMGDKADSLSEGALAGVILYAIQYVFALFVVMIVPFIQAEGKWRSIIPMLGFIRGPKLKDILYAIPLYVMYFGATIVIISLITSLLPSLNWEQTQDVGFDGISHLYEYILAFVALAVLPPLAEEAIFRGYLFGKLRESMGFWPSTIATSLTFAVVHMQLNVGIDVFILSIALCWLRERTGSIWASVFLHSLKNTVAYFFLFIAPIICAGSSSNVCVYFLQ